MSAKVNKKKPPAAGPPGSLMSRYVSFVVLVAIILVCGFYSINVIGEFLLPLFLAALMVVIFRPVHQWMLRRCKGREILAAGLTTGAILLIVLVPFAGSLALAIHEANQAIGGRGFQRDHMQRRLERFRTSAGLQKPFADSLEKIEETLRRLDALIHQSAPRTNLNDPLKQARDEIDTAVHQFRQEARIVIEILSEEEEARPNAARGERAEMVQRLHKISDSLPSVDKPFRRARDDRDWRPEKEALRNLMQQPEYASAVYFLDYQEKRPEEPEPRGYLAAFADALYGIDDEGGTEQRPQLTEAQIAYDNFRTSLFGGPIWKWIIEVANPDTKQIEVWIKSLRGNLTSWLPSITGTATALIARLIVGLAIMILSMFYFFVDGPRMIQTFMRLSPLDDRYETELVQEFDQVSRAVVVATLLSAVTQGAVGAIGYMIVGLDSIFLLTLLTTVLALVPFVGAAAVWVPCCLWLAVVEESYFRAGFLAIYGVAAISMTDNIIKPWVLQGQSKLHPLLALLSVLGGVKALGPIGILVGPMVVAFLQVLLTMLQREIVSLDKELDRSSKPS